MEIRRISVMLVIITVLSTSLCPLVVNVPYAYAENPTSHEDKLPGDINGDGAVNILDFTLLKLIVLGRMQPNGNSDIDGASGLLDIYL